MRRSRTIYAQRRARVLDALRAAVAPQPLDVDGEQGGFHFVWWLPPTLDAADFLAEARRAGLAFQPVAGLSRRADRPPGMLIGDSALQDDTLEAALDTLKLVITRCTRPR